MSRGSQGELFGEGATVKGGRKAGKPRDKKPAGSDQAKPRGDGPAQDPKGSGGRQDNRAGPGESSDNVVSQPGTAKVERASSDHRSTAQTGGASKSVANPSDKRDNHPADQAQGSSMASGPRNGKRKTPSQPGRRKSTPRKKTAAVSRRKGLSRFSIPTMRWSLVFYGAAALAALVLLFLWSQTPDTSYQPSTAFMNGNPPTGGAIIYEEPLPGGTTKTVPDLSAVDEAVFTALRQAGVAPQDTHLALAHGPDGEVSLIKAQLPPNVQMEHAAATLQAALTNTKAQGVWHLNGHGREFSISLAGRLTHKVLLESGRPLKTPSPAQPGPPPKIPSAPPVAPPALGPRLAVIIDDIGYQMKPAKELISLGLPLTLSILPHSPHGQKIAQMARGQGLEVMLHLPMEPRGYPGLKPGPGALLIAMTPEQLRQTTLDDLASVPGAKGANNHMGSRFTEHSEALKPVMQVLSEKGLFFIDSMTSANSRAYAMARTIGLTAARRTVFLDHDPSLPAVRRQLQRILSLAKQGSQVVAIGHPHQATIQALSEFATRLKKEVRVVTASQFLHGTALAGGRGSLSEPAGDQLDRPASAGQ